MGLVLVLSKEPDDRVRVLLEPGATKAVALEQIVCSSRVEADGMVEIADRLARRSSE